MAVALMQSVFFPPADERRTTLSMLGWWEKRRFSYNVVVGTSGLFALAVMKLISIIPPGLPMAGPPWQGVVLFGVAANVCYTFGFGIEFALARLMGRKAPQLGPSLLRQGIAFSVGLTLLPIGMMCFGWLGHAIALLLGKGA